MSISDKRIEQLKDFQKRYNLIFSNINLLNQALSHTSWTYENNLDVSFSYEKLEFLGDAVLKLSISEILYKNFDYKEGELTKLRAEIVSDKFIANFARKLNLNDIILTGNSEKKSKAMKESILACAFEAFLGAIYLEYKDEGFNKALQFISENFLDEILSVNLSISKLNPKALLQEYTQGLTKELPIYTLIKEEGSEHNKTFYTEVSYDNKIIGKGSAKSIKQSQIEAAQNALENLGINQ